MAICSAIPNGHSRPKWKSSGPSQEFSYEPEKKKEKIISKICYENGVCTAPR